MKKILVVSSYLFIGGVKQSLISFLNIIPRNEYSVNLIILFPEKRLLKYVPGYIKIISPPFKKGINLSFGFKYLIKQKFKQKNILML